MINVTANDVGLLKEVLKAPTVTIELNKYELNAVVSGLNKLLYSSRTSLGLREEAAKVHNKLNKILKPIWGHAVD